MTDFGGYVIFRPLHPSRLIVAWGKTEQKTWDDYKSIYGRNRKNTRILKATGDLLKRLDRVGPNHVSWEERNGIAVLLR